MDPGRRNGPGGRRRRRTAHLGGHELRTLADLVAEASFDPQISMEAGC
jgi:hypothetical protein